MEEKNKIATNSVFFIAIEIIIPSIATSVKINNSDSDVVWNSSTWVKFPLELDEIVEKAGEVPQVNLRVSNVNRALESYIQQYDLYCKTNGFQPITIKMYALNSLNLASPIAESEHEFILEKPTLTAEWATFQLGASNPFLRRFPLHRIMKTCRFIFKSTQCGYTGTISNCNKTISRCRQLSNSSRFGGFIGVGSGGLRLAD